MGWTFRYKVLICLLGASLGLGFAHARSQARPRKARTAVVRHAVSRQHRPKAAPSTHRSLLSSASVLVQDQASGQVLLEKAPNAVHAIASITKLMTVMVVLDANQNPTESLTIDRNDVDSLRHSRSHLPLGTRLTRSEALKLALMASENRAAYALGRSYPGGTTACVAAMNAKAQALGLANTHFVDPAGLGEANVSTARDLIQLLRTAYGHYPTIREYTTCTEESLRSGSRNLHFVNTSRLVRSGRWSIGISKTGFIDESGHCLVMQAKLASHSVFIVILKAPGKLTHFGDANRIRTWLETKA